MSRTRLLKTLDSLALAGLLAGILILLAGGLSVRFNDIRLTARTPHRAFIGFAAVLLVRLAVDRRTGPWGARQGWWRRARHGFDDPLADALTPLPRGAALIETAWGIASDERRNICGRPYEDSDTDSRSEPSARFASSRGEFSEDPGSAQHFTRSRHSL